IVLTVPLQNGLGIILAPPERAAAAYALYLSVRSWSAPFVCLNNTLLGWFYGRAAAVTGMILQMIIFGSNIILSIWLVYGLGWGVFGVALATVLGQVLACIIGFMLVLRHYGGVRRMAELASWARIGD